MSRPARIVLVVAAALVAVVLLFTVVFPWVDRTFVADPVLESSAAAVLAAAVPPASVPGT